MKKVTEDDLLAQRLLEIADRLILEAKQLQARSSDNRMGSASVKVIDPRKAQKKDG